MNRSGQLLRRFFSQPDKPEADMFDGWNVNELVSAMYAVTWWRGLHAQPLSKVAANLRYHVAKEGGEIKGRIDVTQRLKRRSTLINKLEREPTMALTQMQDIGGVRARLPSLDHVTTVSRRLKKTWTITRTYDYVTKPKPSGYRAIHHIVRRDGHEIEVQLRTVRQDAWANQVEDDGRHLGVGFKFGFGDADVHKYYVSVSAAFAALDRGEKLSQELVAELNQDYQRVRRKLKRAP